MASLPIRLAIGASRTIADAIKITPMIDQRHRFEGVGRTGSRWAILAGDDSATRQWTEQAGDDSINLVDPFADSGVAGRLLLATNAAVKGKCHHKSRLLRGALRRDEEPRRLLTAPKPVRHFRVAAWATAIIRLRPITWAF